MNDQVQLNLVVHNLLGTKLLTQLSVTMCMLSTLQDGNNKPSVHFSLIKKVNQNC